MLWNTCVTFIQDVKYKVSIPYCIVMLFTVDFTAHLVVAHGLILWGEEWAGHKNDRNTHMYKYAVFTWILVFSKL